MKISRYHSHLNGYEFLKVHIPHLWDDVCAAVMTANAQECISKGRSSRRPYLVSQLKKRMQGSLVGYGWKPHLASPGTKLLKNRVAVNVKFGGELLGPHGLLANHIEHYSSDVIDVGIEILPTKELSEKLSSVAASYEDELGSLTRVRRGVPAVPLVLIGVAP